MPICKLVLRDLMFKWLLRVWWGGVHHPRTNPITAICTHNAANKLGREGMEALAPALRHLKLLQELYLDSKNQLWFCSLIFSAKFMFFCLESTNSHSSWQLHVIVYRVHLCFCWSLTDAQATDLMHAHTTFPRREQHRPAWRNGHSTSLALFVEVACPLPRQYGIL